MRLNNITTKILRVLREFDFKYLAKDYGDNVVHAYKEKPHLVDNAIYETDRDGGLSLSKSSIEMFLLDYEEYEIYDILHESDEEITVNSEIKFEDGVISIIDILSL